MPFNSSKCQKQSTDSSEILLNEKNAQYLKMISLTIQIYSFIQPRL